MTRSFHLLPVFLLLSGFIFALPLCRGEDDFASQRRLMVAEQIRARGIDRAEVLRAMNAVPRHLFVPAAMAAEAYQDRPLPIGNEQTISQPYIVALMTQMLAVQPGRRVLEVGTGSGYQAAVLAEMGVDVYSIEIVPELADRAGKLLADLGYHNVHVKTGDGYKGWKEAAPFDGIIVTCAPKKIPEPLKRQLAENGRMVIPVGGSYIQKLVRLTKKQGRIMQEDVLDVLFVPMVDEKGRKY